jgi:hypothetical protein
MPGDVVPGLFGVSFPPRLVVFVFQGAFRRLVDSIFIAFGGNMSTRNFLRKEIIFGEVSQIITFQWDKFFCRN